MWHSFWLLCLAPISAVIGGGNIGHVTTSFVLFKKTATGHHLSQQRKPASFPLHFAFAVFRASRANVRQSCGGAVLCRSDEFEPSMLTRKEHGGTPPDTRHNKQQIRMRLHIHQEVMWTLNAIDLRILIFTFINGSSDSLVPLVGQVGHLDLAVLHLLLGKTTGEKRDEVLQVQ